MKSLPTPNSIVTRHRKGEKRSRFVIKMFNKLLVFLYKIYILPLFGLGSKFVIVETIGRKTGKKRPYPTLFNNYYTNIPTIYSAKGKKADWVKNIVHNNNQTLIYKGFKKKLVSFTFVEDPQEKFLHLKYFCENYKSAKSIFGYDRKKDQDILSSPEFYDFAQTIEFLQFRWNKGN